MAQEYGETGGASCCRFRMPSIPLRWLLFIDFAFTFGTTIVYLADIVTDIITLKTYYDRGWYYAFGFSIGFIVVPSFLLAVLECQFLLKMYGKNIKWCNVIANTLLNIPLQLTVIWYHCKLSYRYFKVWLNDLQQEGEKNPVGDGDKRKSMSNLADLDDRANTLERRAIMSVEVPVAADEIPVVYPGQTDQTWWKQLTREEWLSHLNKMKLIESMLESLPQLLINLYLIVSYQNTPVIQYLSATLSYLSLCGGIVRYDKTRKDNEADRLMVDRTLLHSRAFTTRLEWPQILFLSMYKGFFLAARILVFVYFTVYFQWYVLVFVFIHWAVLMCYLVYLWYPTDIDKKTKQLVQADYKFRAYMFLSQDCFSVFLNSLIGIFVSVRPQNYGFVGQPYCYLFWFYFAFIIENIILFLIPGVYFSILDEENMLVVYQYYIVLIFELLLNLFGAILCTMYYFSVHKMSVYTRNAYPSITKIQTICCCSAIGQPVPPDWTVCKQAETSEIFFLRRENLNEYKNSYNTVVRGNRKRGRNLECFIDERGKIFYAPRRRLFKKLPTQAEEEWVEIRRGASNQSLDAIEPEESSVRPESRISANERLVGEDSTFDFIDNPETEGLLSSVTSPPPLPTTPPQSSTPLPDQIPASVRSSKSGKSIQKNSQLVTNSSINIGTPSKSTRESARSSKSRTSRKVTSDDQPGVENKARKRENMSEKFKWSGKSSKSNRTMQETNPNVLPQDKDNKDNLQIEDDQTESVSKHNIPANSSEYPPTSSRRSSRCSSSKKRTSRENERFSPKSDRYKHEQLSKSEKDSRTSHRSPEIVKSGHQDESSSRSKNEQSSKSKNDSRSSHRSPESGHRHRDGNKAHASSESRLQSEHQNYSDKKSSTRSRSHRSPGSSRRDDKSEKSSRDRRRSGEKSLRSQNESQPRGKPEGIVMSNSGPPPTKRMRFSGEELKKYSKDELIDLYVKQQDLLDGPQRKSSETEKDGGDKMKSSLSETSRRENLLMMRLATKEQEMQQYAAQITHIKKSQEDAAAKSLREAMLDPAINLLFNKMKDELKETKDKLEQAQSELGAWKFTPDSQTGKKLMSRCRTLIAENQELGKQLSQGKVAQLEAELALQKKYSEELKESQEELNEFVIQLDEEVEGMQSTIQHLQQQLTDSRKELEKYKKMAENMDFTEHERTKVESMDIRTKNVMEVTTSEKEIGDQDSKPEVGVNGVYENQNGVDSLGERSFENSEFVCKEECESDGENVMGEENPMEVDKYESGGEGKEGENTPTYSEHEVIDESQDSTPDHSPRRALSNNGEVGENIAQSSIESIGHVRSPINDETYEVIDNGSDDETEHIAQIVSTNDTIDEGANNISYVVDKAPRTPTHENEYLGSENQNHGSNLSENSHALKENTPHQIESDVVENTIPDKLTVEEERTSLEPESELQQKESTFELNPVSNTSAGEVILVENANVQQKSSTAEEVQQLAPQSVPRTEVITPTNGPQTMLPPFAHSLMTHAHVPLMGDATNPYLMNPHFQQLPNAALAQQQAFMAEQQALMYKTMLAQQQQQQQQLVMNDDKNNPVVSDGTNAPRTGEDLRTMNPLMHGLPYADPTAAFMAQYKAMLAAQQMFVPGPDGKTPQMLAPGGLGLYPGLPLVQPAVVPQPTTDPVTNGVTTSWPSCTNVTYAPHPLMTQGFLGTNSAGMMLYPGHNLASHAVTATPAVTETDTKQHHGSGDHGPIQNGLPAQKTPDVPDTNPKEDPAQHAVA